MKQSSPKSTTTRFFSSVFPLPAMEHLPTWYDTGRHVTLHRCWDLFIFDGEEDALGRFFCGSVSYKPKQNDHGVGVCSWRFEMCKVLQLRLGSLLSGQIATKKMFRSCYCKSSSTAAAAAAAATAVTDVPNYECVHGNQCCALRSAKRIKHVQGTGSWRMFVPLENDYGNSSTP
jgi:hypothetical protein